MPKKPSDSDILNEISSKLDDLQAAVTDLSKAVADLHGALRHGFAQVNARFDALERRFG